MKLTKKMEKELKERALKLKELYEKPDEEVDRTNTKEVENILRKTN